RRDRRSPRPGDPGRGAGGAARRRDRRDGPRGRPALCPPACRSAAAGAGRSRPAHPPARRGPPGAAHRPPVPEHRPLLLRAAPPEAPAVSPLGANLRFGRSWVVVPPPLGGSVVGSGGGEG